MSNHQRSQPKPTALCASFGALLPILDLPDIDADAAARARAHLSTCAYCQAQRALYQQLDAAIRGDFGPDGPPYYQTEEIMRDLIPDQEAVRNDRKPAAPVTRESGRTRRFISGLAAFAAVLVIIVISVALFSGHLFTRGPGATHTPTSKPIATSAPNPGSGVPGGLNAISMLSPTEGWAAGEYTHGNNGQPQTVALLHYFHTTWTPVDLHMNGILNSIAMLSPTDGWAAGTNAQADGGLLLRYDGTTWKPFENPTPLGPLNHLQMRSPTEGWAIENGEQIVHYDGHAWTAQPLPASLKIGNPNSVGLYGLSMVSATEGWAVGVLTIGPVGTDQKKPAFGLILHYTGGQWTVASLIDTISLNAVSMSSGTDGWAVGYRVDTGTGIGTPPPPSFEPNVLLHYTGGKWVEVSPPHLQGNLEEVFMASDGDGWITVDVRDQNRQLLLRFTGGQWQQVYAPQTPIQDPTVSLLTIYSIAMTSPDAGWAVGNLVTQSQQGNTVTPLLLHYQNGAWSLAQS